MKYEFGVAARIIEKDISTEDPEILHMVARAYSLGIDYPKDQLKAISLYKIAAEKGYPNSQFNLALAYKYGNGVEKNQVLAKEFYLKAFNGFSKEAENGNANAQAAIGSMYLTDDAIPKNLPKALEWLEKSSNNGSSNGQVQLGEIYLNGIITSKDIGKAINLIQKSVNQGNPNAQFILGDQYFKGINIEKDFTKSFILFQEAAAKNHLRAQHNLGLSYITGRGIQKELGTGFEWIIKAANNGYAISQHTLGTVLKDGFYFDKNEKTSLDWYLKAANQNYPESQLAVGNAYLTGAGVIKDESHALQWWRKAALENHAPAQMKLANALKNGIGGPVNLGNSYFWLLLAGNNGDSNISKSAKDQINDIEKIINSELRISIQKAASSWKTGSPEPTLQQYTQKEAIPSKKSNETSPESNRITFEKLDSTGSGFGIGNNYYITNNHVVNGCSKLKVNSEMASIINKDPVTDLALLKTNISATGQTARVRSDRIKIGEEIAVAGFPLRGLLSGFNFTKGNVSSLSGVGGDSRVLQITAPVQPGNSGGPLLDSFGNVIGVVVSKLSWKVSAVTGDIPQNVNFAINANSLTSFLNSNDISFQNQPLTKELKLVDIAERAKSFTVLVECWK
jgi:TPR repeat protein/V8-like Glu-specific endopeptidase